MRGFRNLRLVMVVCTRAGISVETNNRKHSSVVIFKDSGGVGNSQQVSLSEILTLPWACPGLCPYGSRKLVSLI